jgi:hypothetical protein
MRNKSNIFILLAVIPRILGLLAIAASFMLLSAQALTFTVSFNTFSGPDCVKNKIGVYQTPFMGTAGLPPLTSMAPFLADAGVHDLRYEMGWGKPDTFAYDQIGGTAANPTIDFSQLDPFVQMLKTNNITPLFAMGYDPLPLKNCSTWQCWKDVPNDLNAWRGILQQYAAHYSTDLGIKGIYYEIWNEPDLPGDGGKVFFNGNQSDYGNIYSNSVVGIYAGASDAQVGGPAIAYDTTYVTQSGMLNQPMNFASIHAYDNAPSQVSSLQSALGSKNVPIFMTEYASYTTFSSTGPNSRHAAAATFFDDVKTLLALSNLKKVYWAQWVDDELGMITYSLHKKAIYNAYKIYQTMLPTSRVAVSPDNSAGVNTLAASGNGNAGIVVWNNNTSDTIVTINLNNLPGGVGSMQLYRIDGQNASYIDNPNSENLTINSQWNYSTPASSWTGTVPAQSVIFILATAAPGLESPYGGNPVLIPGTIQVENYDNGGEGIAYHDSEPANQGGQYRTNDGVDIETTTDSGGGYDVGWTVAGEWLKYTVNVQTAGTYSVSFRVASVSGGGSLHLLDQNGTNLTGNVTIPVTGGYQTWTTVNATVTLSAGLQTLEVYEDTGNVNLNYLTFAPAASPAIPITPIGLTAAPGNNQIQLSWNPSTGATDYNLSRALNADGPYTNVVSLITTNYLDSNVVNGTTYYYIVAATNSIGSSTNSLPVSSSPSLGATLVVWFKADAISGVNTGSSLQTWTDSSGNSNNATQLNASQQPTYLANNLNGLPVVHFNNASNSYLSFIRPVQDDFTILCVFRSTQGIGTGTTFYSGAGLVNGEMPNVVNDFGTSLNANGQILAGTGNPDTTVMSATGFNDGRPHVFTFERVRIMGAISLYVDGTLMSEGIAGTQSLTSPMQLVLGSQQTLVNYLTGDIAEVKIYNIALTENDRQSQETQLEYKYAINNFQPPSLTIASGNGNFLFSWPVSAAQFSLQSASNLASPIAWSAVTNAVQTNGGVLNLTLPATNDDEQFFRLQHP